MGCRSIEKCNNAKYSITKGNSKLNDLITTSVLDLASFTSIREFAKQCPNNIDVLINNAGIMATNPKQLSVDGYESQMATNHLGHFLLTSLLFSKLKNSNHCYEKLFK